MKKLLIYLFPFLFLLVTGFSCFNKPSITSKEVIDVITAFDNAWRDKKADQVNQVLASPYIYFTPSGRIFNRDSILATSGSQTYKLDEVERRILSIHISGNTAIADTRWIGKGIYRGKPFDDDQRCSVTLVKKGKTVQILSEHCTSIKK